MASHAFSATTKQVFHYAGNGQKITVTVGEAQVGAIVDGAQSINKIPLYGVSISNGSGIWVEALSEQEIEPFLRGLKAAYEMVGIFTDLSPENPG